MGKDFKALLGDQAFLGKLSDTAEYVGNEFEFATAFELDQEILVSFSNGWSDFSTARVTNFWQEGSSFDAMSQEDIDGLEEDERESLEEEPARVLLAFPDGREEAYEYPELEYYTFGDEALSAALGLLLRETGRIPEADETTLITTSGDHGWALYDKGMLKEASRGPDPDWDEMLAKHGIDPHGQGYEEYQVSVAWVDTLPAGAGFPPELAGIPAEAYDI